MSYFPSLLKVDDDVLTAGNSFDAGTIGAVETAFASRFNVPANFMTAQRVLSIKAWFQETTGATATTHAIRVRWGGIAGTVLLQGNAVNTTINVTRTACVELLIEATAAPGAAVAINSGLIGTGSFPTGVTMFTPQPVVVATNAAADVVFSIQFGAGTAGNVVALHAIAVQYLN